jgi:hypothetical protein
MFVLPFSLPHVLVYSSRSLVLTGALKATGGRGLQPSMDHILEHESDPVPDLANVATGAAAPAAAMGHRPQEAMDVEDDEDSEALRSALKLSQAPEDAGSAAGGGEGGGEAKVSTQVQQRVTWTANWMV